MGARTCAYPGCDRSAAVPFDEYFCTFHAGSDSKGVPPETFNALIFRQIEDMDYNFEGYVFPAGMSFRKDDKAAVFHDHVNFRKARFEGQLQPRPRYAMQDVCVDFSGVQFEDGVDFTEADFAGGLAGFFRTVFEGKEAIFAMARFSLGAVFIGARFSCGMAWFMRSTFGGSADLIGTEFVGGAATFWQCAFRGDIRFAGNKIDCNMTFAENHLGEGSIFYLDRPVFEASNKEGNLVVFDRVRFNPFATFFEGISSPLPWEEQTPLKHPTIIFRSCQLKDVYFTANEMSLFSFHKSSFDQALFTSSSWGETRDKILCFPYRRKNVIFEEQILAHLHNRVDTDDERRRIRGVYRVEDLGDCEEVASLYRRMKTALDGTKDYQEAGWFYFNEFEMKRLALKERAANETKRRTFLRHCRCFLYWWYKVLAGYGEKPLWSLICFWVFSALFTWLHLLFGLNAPDGKYINYDFFLSSHGFKNLVSWGFWLGLIKDGLYALIFALYRVVPVSYLPYQRSEFSPSGLDGLLLSLVNTAVLLLMVIFIGVGLKRHFRRF
jgi:uncharacterized protein YjbI with pentapeptide repeats